MELRCLVPFALTPLHARYDGNGKASYLPGKVRQGEVFVYRGAADAPPRWAEPLDDDARAMYKRAKVVPGSAEAVGRSSAAATLAHRPPKSGKNPLNHPLLGLDSNPPAVPAEDSSAEEAARAARQEAQREAGRKGGEARWAKARAEQAARAAE